MKAIRLYDIQDLRLEEAPIPNPGEKQVLLKIASVGVCGSDVHYYLEGGTGSLQISRPLILGHEFSAWIADGPDQGQLVAVDPAIPCGQCEFCLEGNQNLCPDLAFAGSEEIDGAMQEYLAWPANAVHPLPDHFDHVQAALLEPLGVAIHAINLAGITPGMDVGVLGAGPIGLLIIQMAKASGAGRIFATDKLGSRLEFALDCGATDVFLADGTETSQILKTTNNRGLDVILEAAGDDGSAVDTAVQSARRGAIVVLVGIPTKDETTFSASTARRKGLTLKLSRRMNHTYPAAIRLVSSGMIHLDPLVSHQYPFEEYERAFRTTAAREGIKVILNVSG